MHPTLAISSSYARPERQRHKGQPKKMQTLHNPPHLNIKLFLFFSFILVQIFSNPWCYFPIFDGLVSSLSSLSNFVAPSWQEWPATIGSLQLCFVFTFVRFQSESFWGGRERTLWLLSPMQFWQVILWAILLYSSCHYENPYPLGFH